MSYGDPMGGADTVYVTAVDGEGNACFIGNDPTVLVIGAGQNGLAVAARLVPGVQWGAPSAPVCTLSSHSNSAFSALRSGTGMTVLCSPFRSNSTDW